MHRHNSDLPTGKLKTRRGVSVMETLTAALCMLQARARELLSAARAELAAVRKDPARLRELAELVRPRTFPAAVVRRPWAIWLGPGRLNGQPPNRPSVRASL